ncbi:unnamed protein product [Effrenium voratum]|uniref:Glycosyl hydrolase family 13 catalytic domain-containing protein n=1 Tax=Effrenium voratum TaxID=2562239 RepID=A0AA36HVD3_9DINO|nr:unnamed protein product [Effrenium voratum]
MAGSVPHVPVPPHPTVVLLNARPWLYDIKATSLKEVSEEQLAEAVHGADVVWLQGVWELGPYGRQHDLADPGRVQHFRDCLADFSEADCIGSPYAISRYCCNRAELGTEEDLASFRARLAKRKVGLMLDFVPNHMARDSPWIDKPGLFIQGSEGPVFGRDPYSGDWTDTAQLNYWSETCREHMLQELLSLAERCDGARVDMAMLCINDVIERTWGPLLREQGFQRPKEEFWLWALPRLRERHPDFLLMAECYEYDEILPSGTMLEILRQGFSAAYDKVVYDRLTEGHLDKLRGHIYGHPCMATGQLCHFTENHDEDRAAFHFEGKAMAAALASLTLPGPRMVMWGQAQGFKARLAVHLRRASKEAPDAAIAQAMRGLIAALPSCRGQWKELQIRGDAAWRFLAWSWKGAADVAASVVVVNYSDEEAWANVELGGLFEGKGDTLCMADALTGEVFERSLAALGAEGLVVGLKPFQSHLLLCNFK